jgi:hypothetical protein
MNEEGIGKFTSGIQPERDAANINLTRGLDPHSIPVFFKICNANRSKINKFY